MKKEELAEDVDELRMRLVRIGRDAEALFRRVESDPPRDEDGIIDIFMLEDVAKNQLQAAIFSLSDFESTLFPKKTPRRREDLTQCPWCRVEVYGDEEVALFLTTHECEEKLRKGFGRVKR